MSTERKVCYFCTHEGHRSHECTKRTEPYIMRPINGPQQHADALHEWKQRNPDASPGQIKAESERLARKFGI